MKLLSEGSHILLRTFLSSVLFRRSTSHFSNDISVARSESIRDASECTRLSRLFVVNFDGLSGMALLSSVGSAVFVVNHSRIQLFGAVFSEGILDRVSFELGNH